MNAIRWRGWLVAAVIFVLGVAVGGTVTTWWGVKQLRRTLQSPGATPGLADRAAARIGAELTRELALSPGESAQVQAILSESASNLKAIRVRAALSAGAELRGTTGRIAAVLPPEKHAEFYRIIARRYHRLGLAAPRPAAEHAP